MNIENTKNDRKIAYQKLNNLPTGGLELDANQFLKEKSEAEYYLGLLQGHGGDGHGKRFFNPKLLIAPLTVKEATMSSKLEGTISTVSDVYKYDVGNTPEYSGTAEVSNYRKAIMQSISFVESGKEISKGYIKHIHKILLHGVRNTSKTLGDFRKDDVWIGEKKTDPITKALYVPPKAITVDAHMDNLFDYIDNGAEDILTRVAIAHYQFEAIHPFDDGNGRIGRLLIPLLLFQNRKISLPILYMSGYFDSLRDEYREALHMVDLTFKYEGWLKFFFNSISEQVKQTNDLMRRINKLYDDIADQVDDSKSFYLSQFLAYLFERPVFSPTDAMRNIGSTYPVINNLIKVFEKKGILTKVEQGVVKDKRIKLYSFDRLLKLLMEA